jgi:predicted aldo/keto reductase-like oxidoreductase
MNKPNGMNRRIFLKNSTIGMVGAGVLGGTPLLKAEETTVNAPLKIKAYRTLGRTGFKVSDISSGGSPNPQVLRVLLESGVNYIDTAESYSGGESERTVGTVIKDFDRKSLFITTKLNFRGGSTKENILERTHKCLERMQTDYVDCMMIHSCQTAAEVKSEGFHEAMKQLKSEGKVRFVGISNHGATYGPVDEPMEKVLLAAVEDGRFDMMLLVYNFIQKEAGERVLAAAAAKNMGCTLMKTKPVDKYFIMKEMVEERAKKEGKEIFEKTKTMMDAFKERADMASEFMKKNNITDPREIRDAAVRFVLKNPHVSTVCINFRSFEDIDPFLKLSGSPMTAADEKKLSLYLKGCGSFYCRHACGVCESRCPHGVPVNTIMRYNHYFESQGREKDAMQKYAALAAPRADLCETCTGHCEKACPYNVHIHGLLMNAHWNLSLV